MQAQVFDAVRVSRQKKDNSSFYNRVHECNDEDYHSDHRNKHLGLL